jgi:head-tail adaptor
LLKVGRQESALVEKSTGQISITNHGSVREDPGGVLQEWQLKQQLHLSVNESDSKEKK